MQCCTVGRHALANAANPPLDTKLCSPSVSRSTSFESPFCSCEMSARLPQYALREALISSPASFSTSVSSSPRSRDAAETSAAMACTVASCSPAAVTAPASLSKSPQQSESCSLQVSLSGLSNSDAKERAAVGSPPVQGNHTGTPHTKPPASRDNGDSAPLNDIDDPAELRDGGGLNASSNGMRSLRPSALISSNTSPRDLPATASPLTRSSISFRSAPPAIPPSWRSCWLAGLPSVTASISRLPSSAPSPLLPLPFCHLIPVGPSCSSRTIRLGASRLSSSNVNDRSRPSRALP